MRNVALILLLVALALSAGCTAAPASAPQEKSAPEKLPPADAVRTASGLASVIKQPGTGAARPKIHDKVRVAFTAWNEKGKLVDSSEKHGGPVVFDMTGVIAGWTEALQQMRVGERRRLWVPDALAYPGRPGYPRGMSVFDIELVEIIAGDPPQLAPADIAAPPADATKTSTGLAYKMLVNGAGNEQPSVWDRVTIHYTGWTTDGTMFETSHAREQPSIYDVAKVMPGWREALQLLSVGDRARLWIPEALAYAGRPGKPAGTVVFDLELIAIEQRPEPPRAPADVAAPPRDATKTASGLAYRMLHTEAGRASPKAGDRVEVHYSAWTTDGELFDSSVVRGKPATLPLDRLIAGWAEGLMLMTEGSKALLWIPERLAYQGKPGAPKGMLVYEVELMRIVR